MNRLFEVWDRPDDQFPHLTHILAALPPEAAAWPWHIAWLEPVRLRKFGIDVRQYIEAEKPTTAGWPAMWSDLEAIGTGTLQINNGLLTVPYAGSTPARVIDPPLNVLSSSAAALAPYDTEYWNLWVPDTWVPHLQTTFTDLREAIAGEKPLTA